MTFLQYPQVFGNMIIMVPTDQMGGYIIEPQLASLPCQLRGNCNFPRVLGRLYIVFFGDCDR